MGRRAEKADASLSKIRWHTNRETRYPFGDRSPDPEWFEPIGIPPPWPDRPWIYGVVVASGNGVLAWRRRGVEDDPVITALGDSWRPERIADSRHLRHLRGFGDVGLGAQTLRDQPRLVPSPQELDDPPVPALYRFREAHGLPHHPRAIIYSVQGGLDVIAERVVEPPGLRRAHERLFADRGVRYLACEGGERILRALHAAELLDEVFVTVTDQVIDEAPHEGVLKIFDFESEGADLTAEGKTSPSRDWTFRRWRFNTH